MNQNTQIWDGVCKPPATALKQIKGGRLTGMTDINPQWRYRAMTETFGPCGFGWVYTIDKLWTENGVEGEVMAFAQVSLKIRPLDEWSEPIVGIGGSALIATESKGLRASDECYKMAITDALSVAMKMLGVGADVYMGRWDGSKYREEAPEKPQAPAVSESIVANHFAALEAASSLDELKSAWAEAYASCRHDEKAMTTLIACKEARKKALSGGRA